MFLRKNIQVASRADSKIISVTMFIWFFIKTTLPDIIIMVILMIQNLVY